MFSLHWWPVLCVYLFRLIPFASTAPTDGTRLLHTEPRAGSDTFAS
jgi:hypothetical protein